MKMQIQSSTLEVLNQILLNELPPFLLMLRGWRDDGLEVFVVNILNYLIFGSSCLNYLIA